MSPRSKITHKFRLLPKAVRKCLLFHIAFSKDFSDGYRKANAEKEKQLIAKICSGRKIEQMYRLRIYEDTLTFKWKRNTRTADEIMNFVKQFFQQDDVSRLTTGKKQTKIRCKLKKQKRFLIDTMINAHRKFWIPKLKSFLLSILSLASILDGDPNPAWNLFVQDA